MNLRPFTRLPYCLLLATVLSPAASSAADVQTLGDVERQIESTAARLDELDREVARSRQLKSDLEKAVAEAQSRVGERDQRLSGLEKQINDYDQTLASLESRLAEAQQSVDERKGQLGKVLRSTQAIGKQTPLKVFLQHDNPALADRIGVYTEHVLRAHKQAIDEQLAALKRIKTAQAVALKDRNWLNYIQKKASEQRRNLADSAISKERNLSEIATDLAQKTTQLDQLRADQARLETLVDELRALQSAQSGYFTSGKGQYPAPVAGRVTAHFGDVKSVGKLRWNGMFISAEPGQPVRAVADGEIVYSDWLQGFGMLVIIDHGDSYTSLYGGNRDVTVPVGQWVESGSTIATVGDSGGQSANGVYFEIRHNAQAEDPESWLSPDSGLQSARK